MALSATAYLFFCARILGSRLPIPLYVASFLGTWALYLWDCERGAASGEDRITHPQRSFLFLRRRHTIRRVSFFAALGAVVLVSMEIRRWESGLFFILLSALGVGYVFRLVPGKSRWYRLKDFPYLKSFCVATGWAMGGVGIPETFSRFRFDPVRMEAGPLMIITWGFLLIDTLLLDYRDRFGDRQDRIVTMAQDEGFLTKAFFAELLILAGIGISGTLHAQEFASPMILASILVVLCGSTLFARSADTSEAAYGLVVSAWRFFGAALAAFFL